MNNLGFQFGYNGQVTGQVAGLWHQCITALFSKTYIAARHILKAQSWKTAGPERPASAVGIGPFGLRLRSAGSPGQRHLPPTSFHLIAFHSNFIQGEFICH